ncbi:hypothetical protein A0H81_03062 [Grifola frondosa]|uniref:Uncharacterized protein n=1 Tax=Grifola frondosa TaxID=5627 RepID=A0A1C7MI92_GRIFR|nr:hypothetical protein A0H81_03062 [Grifola frondosa]
MVSLLQPPAVRLGGRRHVRNLGFETAVAITPAQPGWGSVNVLSTDSEPSGYCIATDADTVFTRSYAPFPFRSI